MTAEPLLKSRDRSEVNRHTIIRSKAPLRISFSGGGTDIPAYYEEHGGVVLSSTINRYSYVTLYPRDDHEVRIRSLDLNSSVKYSVNEEPIFDGALDLAKAAIRRMGSERGFELQVSTEAPPGSGLGGSSAVTSAILAAVAEYTGVVVDPYELAELNYVIERVDLGVSGGKQDQYATTFGGFNFIEFYRDRVVVTPLRISRATLNDLESHLMLCYTGKIRPAMGIVDSQIRHFQDGKKTAIEGMQRLQAITVEMKETLLKGQLDRLGELLDEAFLNKRRFNPHITDPRIDEFYRLAKTSGAIGGKLCGAGGGGYLLLYVSGHHSHDVRKALEHAGGQFTSFSFEELGTQTWRSACK